MSATIPKLPVTHRLEDQEQSEVRWQEYVERKAKLYCAQGHDFVENGPMFVCGQGRWRDEADVHFWTDCSRCHIRPDEVSA